MRDSKHSKLRMNSLLRRFTPFFVPIKPVCEQGSSWQAKLDNAKNASGDMLPLELVDENIGSNDGLHRIMKTCYDTWAKPSVHKDTYKFVFIDSSIYMRWMKVHPPECSFEY